MEDAGAGLNEMSIQLLPEILPDVEEGGPGTGSGEHIVIVYDNDYNSFEQVTMILVRATGCSIEEAEMETWEVHNLGKSVVHHGSPEECERAASIIRTIGIHVEVRQD